MKQLNNVQKILNFLDSLKINNLRILDFINAEDITEDLTFEDITELIENNNGFEVEVIYYSAAIDFLKNNDPSLTVSLGLAAEMGFTIESLNSEILASLLASDMLRNDWFKLEIEITDFLDSLNWN